MKLLIDTCTLLWIATDAQELSQKARAAFINPSNEALLSAASCWEISVKYGNNKLPLPAQPSDFIEELCQVYSIKLIPISPEETLYVHKLPDLHHDPFDRMLITQAIIHDFLILTPDKAIHQYGIKTVW